jgi:hypothetical protein
MLAVLIDAPFPLEVAANIVTVVLGGIVCPKKLAPSLSSA